MAPVKEAVNAAHMVGVAAGLVGALVPGLGLGVVALIPALIGCTLLVAKAWEAFRREFSSPPTKPVDLKNATRLLETDMATLVAKARKKLGMDPQGHFNFAVVGAAGVGKSSLINALMYKKSNAPGAAAVGEIETTTKVKKYPHPEFPYLVLWDFPGSLTKGVKANTYFEDYMLYAFDVILVLSSDRFLETDYNVAKKAKTFGNKCVFVRTKCDTAVMSKAKRDNMRMIEACNVLRQEVMQYMKKFLRRLWNPQETKLFFVSSPAFLDKTEYQYKNDKSLVKVGMDEAKLINFLVDSARPRFKAPAKKKTIQKTK